MTWAIGDVVVYGSHGVGRITARRTTRVSGEKHEVVVLELADGLTVTLPLERARDQLRGIATEADIRRIQRTLRAERSLSNGPWLSRRRETLAKLSGGDPVELAEIVSDGAQRERVLKAAGKRGQLSTGERELFVKARRLLAGEIARARGVPPDDADGWIDDQLARSV